MTHSDKLQAKTWNGVARCQVMITPQVQCLQAAQKGHRICNVHIRQQARGDAVMTRRAGLPREQSLAVSSDILKRQTESKEAQAKAAVQHQNATDTGWRDAEQRAREHAERNEE